MQTMKRLLTTSILTALALTFTATLSGNGQTREQKLQQAIDLIESKGDLAAAIPLLEDVAKSADRSLAARGLLYLAQAQERQGQANARRTYERIVSDFAAQTDIAAQARARLAVLTTGAPLESQQVVKQLWSGAGVDALGTPTLDGRYLSFTDWETGDLAIRDFSTNTSRRITNTGGWAASADFAEHSVMSPDGRHVAYAWFTDRGAAGPGGRCVCRYELRLSPVAPGDTGKPRTLLQTEANEWLRPAAFTPDGRQLIVVLMSTDRTYQLVRVTLADGSSRPIASLGWRRPGTVSASADGRAIVYDVPASEESPAHDIFLVTLDDGRASRLVESAAHDRSPIWSADGSQVLFISDRTGTDALWRVPMQANGATGAPVVVLPHLSGNAGLLGAGRNGAVYYWTASQNSNIYHANVDANLRSQNAPAIAIDRFLNTNHAASWSSDGSRVAYLSRRGSNPSADAALMIRTVATGEDREVPVKVPVVDRVSWFPDGRSVLAASPVTSEGRLAFYRIDIETGNAQLLLKINTVGLVQRRPQVSPDGRTVVFVDAVDRGNKTQRLAKFDVTSGQETELKRFDGNDEYVTSFGISPDGRMVAFLRYDGRSQASILEVMPSAGGASRELFRQDNHTGTRYAGVAWSNDAQHVLFVRNTNTAAQPATALWKVPAAGGTAEPTGLAFSTPIYQPSLDPKGGRVTFSGRGGGTAPAIWAVEHFLPKSPAIKR